MNRIVKKTVLSLALLLLGSLQVPAQHYIGVRGGYGAGQGRLEGSSRTQYGDMKMVWGMWSGGIAWKYYSNEKILGGVGAEVEFLQKAYEYHILNGSNEMTDTTYRRVINSVQVPLIWQPHFNMFNNRFRVFINLGISVQYNFPVSKVDSLFRGEVYHSSEYRQKLVRDNPFGYGLLGGVGFNVIRDRWEFTLEARYYFGYGDILRHTSKYPGETDPGTGAYVANPRRSPLDNLTISTGFFYRLSDGAHNPPPSKRRQRREDKRREEQILEALRARQLIEPELPGDEEVIHPEIETQEEAPFGIAKKRMLNTEGTEEQKSATEKIAENGEENKTGVEAVKRGTENETEVEAGKEKQETSVNKTESKEDGNYQAAKSS